MKLIVLFALLTSVNALALGLNQPAPIIDVHMHALPANSQGAPPVGLCAPPKGYPAADSGSTWADTFTSFTKNPPCIRPLQSPMTDRELMERTLAIMKRRNVTGVASGPLVKQWRKEGGDRIIPGLLFTLGPEAPSVDSLRASFKSGEYAFLGEIALQYQGIEPGDPRFEPYLKLAEEGASNQESK